MLEPRPAPGIPDCPEHLQGEARAEWNRITIELAALNMLTRCDRAVLAAYCSTWARWREAEEIINKEGLILEGEKGVSAHPAVAIARDCKAQIKSFAVEFGLTPAARSRLSVKPEKKKPGLEDEFFGDPKPEKERQSARLQ